MLDKDIDVSKGIVSYFVNRPLLINVFLVLVFLTGAMTLGQMKRDQFPEVDMKRTTVTTIYPGASPQDVELKVTKVIEDQIKTMPNIKRYYSTSVVGQSIIVVDFIVDLDKITAEHARAELRSKVKNAESSLPSTSGKPVVEDLDSSAYPIVYYMIYSDQLSEQQIREAVLQLEYMLRGVSSVKQTFKVGFRNREYQALADTEKLDSERVSLSTISSAITDYNIRNGGGSVDEAYKKRNVVVESLFGNIGDLANLTIRENFMGSNIKIKDIGAVNAGFAPPSTYSRSERSNGVLLQVLKKTSADILSTVDQLDTLVNGIKPYFEKEYGGQLRIVKTLDMSTDIRDMLHITWENGWEGFVLVLIVMWIFLDFRTAFWAAFNIPVSISMTLVWVYFMYDYGFNMITMFGLITVIGIVVDQGIVVAENIYQKIEQGLSPKRATIIGTNQIARAILAAVMVTIMAFAPMLMIGDVIGNFVRALPVVIVVALIASTIEVFISLPTHILGAVNRRLAHAKKKGLKAFTLHATDTDGKFTPRNSMGWFSAGYKGCLRFLLKFRYLTVIGFILFAYIGFHIAKKVPFIFLSNEQSTTIQATFVAQQGYTLDQTYHLIQSVENTMIEEVPYGKELRTVTTQVGVRRDDATNPSALEANTAYLQLLLVPYSERIRSAAKIVSAIRDRLNKDDLIKRSFQTMTVNVKSSGPPSDADFQWRIACDDQKLLYKVAQDFENFVKGIKGVYGVDNTAHRIEKQLHIHMKDDVMNRLGVNPATVSSTVLMAYSGTTSSNYVPDIWDPTYVRLALAEKYQRNIQQLPNLLIPATKNQVRLSQVADISEDKAPYVYVHYDGRESYTVNGFVDDRLNTALNVDIAIRKQFLPKYKSIPTVSISQSGEGEMMATAFGGMARAAVIAIVGIMVILVLTLNSVIQSIFLILLIPFALAGVFFGFYFQHSSLGFFGVIGILGLAGVVVNHAVVLVDVINHKFAQYHVDKTYTRGYQDFVIRTCETRLRPIILTTLCTVLGLIPAIYGLGGSNDFLKPLAIALADGLLAGMLVTIFLIPCFYHIQRDVQLLFVKLFKK